MTISIAKPNVGDVVKESTIDDIIDALSTLETNQGAGGSIIPNASFEFDTDADGEPNCWTATALTGGVCGLSTATTGDGGASWYATSDGVAGHGGATLVSDYIPYPEGTNFLVWWMKATDATMTLKIQIDYYTCAKVDLSATETIYNASSGNPTSWTRMKKAFTRPSTARYFKIKIVGGDTSSVAGTCYWDAFDVFTSTTEDAGFFTSAMTTTFDSGTTLQWTDSTVANSNGQFTVNGAGSDYAITVNFPGVYMVHCVSWTNVATYSPAATTFQARFQSTDGSGGEGTTVLTGITTPECSVVSGLVTATTGSMYKVRATSSATSSMTVTSSLVMVRVK